MVALDRSQEAQARARLYGLAAEVFRYGVTAELIPSLRVLPRLEPLFRGEFQADEAAAEHHRVFSYEVFPHEAVFVEEASLVGGNRSTALTRWYRVFGFVPPEDLETDHLSCELMFLSWLSEAEAHGEQVADEVRVFLDQHLLRWLPALTLALRGLSAPVYALLADMTLEVAADQRRHLGPSLGFSLPEPPALLDDPKAGLKQVARYLTTPCFAGGFLARSHIDAVARDVSLPRGFGSREGVLETLFFSGARLDQAVPMLQALRELLLGWQGCYQELAAEKGLGDWVQPWIEHAAQADAMVLGMMQAIAAE